MTKKYQVRFPAPGKKKQIFTVKAKSRMDAWKIGAGKYLGKHGNKHFINTHYPTFSEVNENEYKSVAHTIRDVLEHGFGDKEVETVDLVYEPEEDYFEEEYIEERRKGPTTGLTRERQRLGALRKNKSLSGPKLPRKKKRPLEEVVRADQGDIRGVTRFDRTKGKVVVVRRFERRKDIDLENEDPKVPRKNKGYRPFTFWDGTTYNN
jgi:hypothetical protein